jgi:hypothetical protein
LPALENLQEPKRQAGEIAGEMKETVAQKGYSGITCERCVLSLLAFFSAGELRLGWKNTWWGKS